MSASFLIWNAQGIVNRNPLGILSNLCRDYFVSFVAILEPQNDRDPSFVSRKIGLTHRHSNSNNKIWIFAHNDYQVDIMEDSDQLVHVRVSAAVFRAPLYLTAVYAKCSREGRYPLWETLRDVSLQMEGCPWLVGGDFNIFLTEEERVGSTSDRHLEITDFADAISDCQLIDPGFDGSVFTWERPGLLERLDRVLIGEHWESAFAATRVTHLPRVASDHAPLLVRCQFSTQMPRASFRFQNMWVRHHSFTSEITRVWEEPTGFEGMLNLQFKLSHVKGFLKGWNVTPEK